MPTFDAHIEVYSPDKIVRVDYDTPYVKGLPVTLTIKEKTEDGCGGVAAGVGSSGTGGPAGYGYHETLHRPTYEDPYTLEFLAFHACVVDETDRPPKTSAADARLDLDIFAMILRAGQGVYHC